MKMTKDALGFRAVLLESLSTMWHPVMVEDLMDQDSFRGVVNAAAQAAASAPSARDAQRVHDAVLDRLDMMLRYTSQRVCLV